jgi:hypothetical protein
MLYSLPGRQPERIRQGMPACPEHIPTQESERLRALPLATCFCLTFWTAHHLVFVPLVLVIAEQQGKQQVEK